MTAPLPPDEAQRLQTLRDYDILDTPPEKAFDRLVARATLLFQVPIALISLVDVDRQWFKACFGVDIRETSRELSFCAHAILTDQVMVVPDTYEDPRFAEHPMVAGPPHVRFYAGAPLIMPDGHKLGTFCVVDTVPRQLSDEQQEMLSDLAAVVVDQLRLRRIARELREERAALQQSEEQFRQFAENINDAFWMIEPCGDDIEYLYISPNFEAVWGRPADELKSNPWAWVEDVHPEDRKGVLEAISAATQNKRSYEVEFRLLNRDGQTRWIRERCFPILDEAGQIYRYAGISQDFTPVKEAEEMLRRAKAQTEQLNLILEGRVQERTKELDQSQIEILTRLARAAEYRDDDTGQHTQRVGRTASLLAQALGCSTEQISLMRQAAPLHDVGKIAISDLILLKPGKLTDDEFAIMKTHAALGAALLADGRSAVVQMAECIAGAHHERWDGRGYPNRLAGEQIPLEGRILAVADVFDALTHDRPYKEAWPVGDAVDEIRRQSGQQFDPRVVDAFLRLPHHDLI